jgi:F420-dependent oxidoreductase-like protein
MRFGTFVPQGWKGDQNGIPVEDQWNRILGFAELIEDAGYDSIWVYDHFHTHPVVTQESTFDAWTLMAALAAVTNRVRLGQMCTCALYRPPSLLAKMASNIDVISGGRLDVGIGAGWSKGEFEAYGYRFPPPGERLDMLEEAIQVLLAMWTQDEARFTGEHYSVNGAINRPQPIQKPHPPLWVAGGGEKRTLRLVAQYGDYANFGDNIDEFRHKSQVLASHCETVGRPYDEIGRTIHRMSVIGRDETDLRRKLGIAAGRRACTAEEFAEEHFAVTLPQAVEEMGEFIAEGCTDMILYFYDMGEGDSLELFASEVMPQLR